MYFYYMFVLRSVLSPRSFFCVILNQIVNILLLKKLFLNLHNESLLILENIFLCFLLVSGIELANNNCSSVYSIYTFDKMTF